MKKPAKKLPAAKSKIVKTVKATKAAAKKIAPPARKKASASETPATSISVQVDIGFGNHLSIRGSGPGLSWHEGIVMDCVGPTLWTIAIKQATKPVIFKVLVNDLTWSAGVDYTVGAGKSVTITPTF